MDPLDVKPVLGLCSSELRQIIQKEIERAQSEEFRVMEAALSRARQHYERVMQPSKSVTDLTEQTEAVEQEAKKQKEIVVELSQKLQTAEAATATAVQHRDLLAQLVEQQTAYLYGGNNQNLTDGGLETNA